MENNFKEITAVQIKQIMRYVTDDSVAEYLPHLNDTMRLFHINTTIRQCHFLAQIAHESGSLNYVREIASGKAYEGRHDLGNIHPGDGPKFKGRGLIQLTGRRNYQCFQDWLNLNVSPTVNIMNEPELLERPALACRVAGWYWDAHNLNYLADRDNIVAVTRRINGGTNGLSSRMDFLNRAKLVLDWI